ncbi:MAG: BPSS1780 family membrane protein [Polaromonas sp.]|nr:BPSS1780 family membrane protein [Polaromonas sp.]
MKLNIVPARTGLTWVRLGIQTFWRQPLAMSGLFFMFMAMLSVVMAVPLIGVVLALVLLPAATLGLMAGTEQAIQGKFPMPSVLISGFRNGAPRMRAMLILGALYATGFLGLMGLSALMDGGQFASLYLIGGEVTQELVMQNSFQAAMWLAMALHTLLSLLFWHAPALVHWHGLPPVKSLFFSLMASYKNFGAFAVFAAAWAGLLMLAIIVVSLITSLVGSPALAVMLILPVTLVIMAMFFTSIYFTFRDSFTVDDEEQASAAD